MEEVVARMTHIRCTSAVHLLESVEDSSVQLVIADPPYGISYQSNHRKGGKSPPVPFDDHNFQIGPFLIEAARVLRTGGALYLFTRWDVYPVWYPSIPIELKLRNVIVWLKNNWSAGDLTGNYGGQWEAILFLTKGRHKLRCSRWSNVWAFSRVHYSQALVPTQKPVDLIERMILSSSDEGDLVIDPFCGSGTTGLAARACGRRYLLGDISQQMIDLTTKRLNNEAPCLPDHRPYLSECPKEPSIDIDLSALDGVHPEDIADIAHPFSLLREKPG